MWQVVGQNRAVSLLQRSLEKGSLSHAYLFVGPPHVGKMTLALNLAQTLNCDATEPPCGECVSCQKTASAKHPDVQTIGLATNNSTTEVKPRVEISIEQVREMQHSASLPPFEGKYKTFIINGAEQLSIEAANCLLKLLEEPASYIVFMLLTTNERLLPATVLSRCQRLELLPMATTDIEATLSDGWGIEPQKARLLAKLSHGHLGWAMLTTTNNDLLQQRDEMIDKLQNIMDGPNYEERFAYARLLASQFSQRRDIVQEVLTLWLEWWHDLLLINTGCPGAITNIDYEAILVDTAKGYDLTQIKTMIISIQAASQQLKQNANPQLVLEVLMLRIPEKERIIKYG
ncbi:ATP-binding protein [Chloroflexota bacterium]